MAQSTIITNHTGDILNETIEASFSVNVKLPESFSFNPNEWHTWKKRFERYHSLSKLKNASGKQQIDMLIYCMGEKSEEILDSFNLGEPDSSNFDKVFQCFENYFVPKKNLIFERVRFLKRKQGQNENIEHFVTELHTLAKNCEWGNIMEQMILMVLIIGMRDESLSDRLQLETDLKLETAINTIRKSEELARQKQELAASDVDIINKSTKITTQSRHKSLNQNKQSNKLNETYSNNHNKSCFWCGKIPFHSKDKCPARNNTCIKCFKRGHFSSVCRSTRVDNIETQETYSPNQTQSETVHNELVCPISNISKHYDDPWAIDININDSDNVCFKIDTGADVSVMPSNIKLNNEIRLQPTTKILKGANGKELSILGKATIKMSYKNNTCFETVYFTEGLVQPLLGKPAIENLHILSRINEINNNNSVDWYVKHPNLFQGLGTLMCEYKVELKDGATPYAINTPRRIPLPLWQAAKEELEKMKKLGVITEVHHATDWCAPMVVVPKKNPNQVRICVDLSKLNKSVKRRYYPIQPVDITLAQISGATVYSKLDANYGFWQVKLDEQSQDLTTFLTPFGRFKFLKLPFGISSAPEVFQECVNKTLSGQRNATAHMDDIVVWGKNQEEHDLVLEEVLKKLEKAGFTLNKEKTLFSQKSITYLGHHLSSEGIQIDKEKVKAIIQMPPPKDVSGVQRFIGMINFVGKYIPNKSQILKPISELLSAKSQWYWGNKQQAAFEQLKQLLTSTPQLAFYDLSRPTMISADSSQSGLGGVLLQQQPDKTWKPISYISRTLTESEKNYSNIEREALAVTWSCDKFKDYIIGKDILIETDHKPLTSILTTKDLNDLTPRLLRLRLRLMRYSYTVRYTPGKHLNTADCLSRSPLNINEKYDLEDEVEATVNLSILTLNTTDAIIQKIAFSQQTSPVIKTLREYCSSGWPELSKIPSQLKPYFSVRHEISVCDDLLMRNNRLVIPKDLQPEMLTRIHTGHLGVTKCRLRANKCMWWPGIFQDIERTVSECPQCVKLRTQHHEPLVPSDFPSRPWEKSSIDLFKLDGKWYVTIMDHYSRFIEIATLKTLTTSEVIEKCKSVFSRYGIPNELHSDCGTQFASQRTCLGNAEFRQFAKTYNFTLVTSSPSFHQSNGSAEAAVKIAKNILAKNKEDPYLALLAYRNTPLTTNGLSPAQILFNRTLRDNLPILPRTLEELPDLSNIREREETYRQSYKIYYDKRHGVKDLEPLKIGQKVWITDIKRNGEVTSFDQNPRSYWVRTDNSTIRRNRYHLIPYSSGNSGQAIPLPLTIQPPSTSIYSPPSQPSSPNHSSYLNGNDQGPIQTRPLPQVTMQRPQQFSGGHRTKSGRLIKPPRRFQSD